MPEVKVAGPSEAVCSPSIPPAAEGEAGALSERATSGQFLPGKSGNPAGKPVGTRNKITILTDNLHAALLDYANKPAARQKAQDGLDRMFDIMATGEDKDAVSAYKAIFGKFTPDAKAAQDESRERPPSVHVTITTIAADQGREVKTVIQGKATEVYHE